MSSYRPAFFFLLGAFFFAAFAAGGPAVGLAGTDEGRAVFGSKNCGACHQISGPARDRTIKDKLAGKGPELWYSGSKFAPGFLQKWLADPAPIRPMEFYSLTEKNGNDHPRLSKGEARDVAAYLMSLKSPAVGFLGLRPAVNRPGKVVFIKKMACYGCHQVTSRNKTVGGLTGPSLVNAGARLNPDWIYAYLKNPGEFKPVKAMPTYAGIIPDKDMMAVAAYIATFGR
jgi:mono/diheme cytochrome c family protein